MELYHFGIKGQKWGRRRWQNTDGSLTPEGYPHYGYNGPREGSYTIKKGTKLYRTSDRKETDIRKGEYATADKSSSVYYEREGIRDALDFKQKKREDYVRIDGEKYLKEIYSIQIDTIDDAQVLSGKQLLDDILEEYENETLAKVHEHFKAYGVYDAETFLEKNAATQILRNANAITFDEQTEAGNIADEYLKKHKEEIFDKYAKMGYDAIEDPMDSMYSYKQPLIILNKEKFKVIESGRKTAQEVLEDHEKEESSLSTKYGNDSDLFERTFEKMTDAYNKYEKEQKGK